MWWPPVGGGTMVRSALCAVVPVCSCCAASRDAAAVLAWSPSNMGMPQGSCGTVHIARRFLGSTADGV